MVDLWQPHHFPINTDEWVMAVLLNKWGQVSSRNRSLEYHTISFNSPNQSGPELS